MGGHDAFNSHHDDAATEIGLVCLHDARKPFLEKTLRDYFDFEQTGFSRSDAQSSP
jgi:hypothetical protein